MTTAEQLEQWRGRRVVDADGEDIGKLEDVYYAPGGEPVLVRVSSGFFGRHHAIVPLADSSVSREHLRVAYRREQIKQAGTGDIGEVMDAAAATSIGRAYGIALTDGEAGYESATQIEARRAAALAADERATALEQKARHAGEEAATTRDDASEADVSATEAERDAAVARQAASEARRQANAADTRPPT
jgi:hypothetical protein